MIAQKILDASFVVGESETEVIRLNEKVLSGVIITGSAITGTEMTFLVSADGTTFYPLFLDDGTEYSVTISGSARAQTLDQQTLVPWVHVKARLGTSASAVNQATYDQGVKFIIQDLG